MRASAVSDEPVVSLRGATLRLGGRTLWSNLDLDIAPGEFVAVLGGNGSGKTSLLRTMLGVQVLSEGEVCIGGQSAQRGAAGVGYVPQQRRSEPFMPLRARDVVRHGIDGHRFGIARLGSVDWSRVDTTLATVGAAAIAEVPMDLLSGGEQQRVRIAQALVGDPKVLLCDEPLASLDPAAQQMITALLDQRRRDRRTAVVFVTHEIDPVLDYVDRVVYLAEGDFRIGTVEEVLTTATLSELYGTEVEVLHVGGRTVVVGTSEDHHHPREPVAG